MNVYVLFLFDSYKQSRSSCSVLRWGNVSCVYSTDHALSIQRLPLSNTFHIWSVELTCWNPARMNIFTGRCLPGRNQIRTHDSKRLRCQAYARRSAISGGGAINFRGGQNTARKLHVSILYFSMCVCLFVCYRFSRQPLNRLLWNLARCFEMISERQLTILVSIGCIFNELPRMRYALYWARISVWTATVTWQWFGFTFINALSSALSDVKHLI